MFPSSSLPTSQKSISQAHSRHQSAAESTVPCPFPPPTISPGPQFLCGSRGPALGWPAMTDSMQSVTGAPALSGAEGHPAVSMAEDRGFFL